METNVVEYVRLSGSIKDKFSFINDSIFEVGDYLFVPKELYLKLV